MRITISIEIRRSERREPRPERDSHLGASTQPAPRVKGPYSARSDVIALGETQSDVTAPEFGFVDPRKKNRGDHRP